MKKFRRNIPSNETFSVEKTSLPNHQEKSLEENTSLLKKNLCTKDEIIKKLVETQSTVLNTISAKANNQHSNTQNQSSSSLSFKSLNDTKQLAKQLPNTKQLASQELQHAPITRPCSSHNCKKYRIPFKHTSKDPSEILQ